MTNQAAKATLMSLHIGKPAWIAHGSKQVLSGIFKKASKETHFLSMNGLEGDGQGDTIHHGGVDKAVCVYFQPRYSYWEHLFDRLFPHGSFGENFTLSNWTEENLCIGDIVEAGEAVLQVSQPRQPCYKLGLRNELPSLPMQAQQTGYTGFYFRVLKEGHIRAGESLIIAERHSARKSIAEANRVMYIDKEDVRAIQELLQVQELSASWREQLEGRLVKLQMVKQGERHDHQNLL